MFKNQHTISDCGGNMVRFFKPIKFGNVRIEKFYNESCMIKIDVTGSIFWNGKKWSEWRLECNSKAVEKDCRFLLMCRFLKRFFDVSLLLGLVGVTSVNQSDFYR